MQILRVLCGRQAALDRLWRRQLHRGGGTLLPALRQEVGRKVTNYDLIKAMSVEEMARENIYFVPNNKDFHYTGLSGKYRKTSKEVIADNIKWLEGEVEDNEITDSLTERS